MVDFCPPGACGGGTLPYAVVSRTAGGLPSEDALRRLLDGIGLPCIVKPVHLGSSIGVGKADTVEEVRALLPTIFRISSLRRLLCGH